VINLLCDCVLKTLIGHFASGAYTAGVINTDPVAGEEHCRRKIPAVPLGHPTRVGVQTRGDGFDWLVFFDYSY
jgi:hypothetical protein